MITRYFRFYGDCGLAGTDQEMWVKITAETEQKCLERAGYYESDLWANIRDEYDDDRFIDYPYADDYDDEDEYQAACDEARQEYEYGITVDFDDITDYVVENKPYDYSFAFGSYEVTDWSTIEWEEIEF